MKKNILLLVLLFASHYLTQAQETQWTLDKSHASINFTVKHMVISEVYGSFKTFDINVKSDKDDFSDAKFEVEIQVNSINTQDENRDKHLLGDGFFDATKFPTIKFSGMSLTKIDKDNYKATGNLTAKGITKPISFDVILGGVINVRGKTVAGFKFKGEINRQDFGLTYNSIMETGGLAIGNDIQINGSFEIVKKTK